MSLALIQKLLGQETADKIAFELNMIGTAIPVGIHSAKLHGLCEYRHNKHMRPTQKSLRTFRSADVKRYVLKMVRRVAEMRQCRALSRKKIERHGRNVALVVSASRGVD